MFLYIIFVIILSFLMYWWHIKIHSFWSEYGVPQMQEGLPLRTNKNCVYIFDEIYKKYRGRSCYVGLYKLFQPTLMVLTPETIKLMFVRDSNFLESHNSYYNEKDDPLSANLFTLDEYNWKNLRSKLAPTFNAKQMCPLIIEKGTKLEKLVTQKGLESIDMKEILEKFFMDAIANYIFGLESDPKFLEMGMKVVNQPRYNNFVMFILKSYPKLARKFNIKVNNEEVSSYFLQLVNDLVESNQKKNTFLNSLIALRNPNKSSSVKDSLKDGLSMNEITAHCFSFILLGFETSVNVSNFTLFELAKHPEIQQNLRQHIKEVLMKHDGQLSHESLSDMSYLDQCIYESMRKHPPIAMLSRKTTKTYTLPGTNCVIPKGIAISVPIYSIHNDNHIFPHPEKYDPGRFAPEEVMKRHAFAYLPFGEGPRNCVGEEFGMIQIKIAFVYLIQNFRFVLNDKTKSTIKYKRDSFILTPDSPILFDAVKI